MLLCILVSASVADEIRRLIDLPKATWLGLIRKELEHRFFASALQPDLIYLYSYFLSYLNTPQKDHSGAIAPGTNHRGTFLWH